MTEKRFRLGADFDGFNNIYDNERTIGCERTIYATKMVKLLNELHEENKELKSKYSEQCIQLDFLKDENRHMKSVLKENKELKSILQDMGLIMSNEEVKNVRDEIASKLIKPLCKGNGFDVDVNTENGFTIIPKEVNNAENKRYDVIYEKEPRGQVVTDNGIPCTARTCCTRLNWLEEENTRLKDKYERKDRQLQRAKKDIRKYTDYFMNELNWDCDRIIKRVFR